ncbi:MAG: helix-turn-helix domain-containing protein [Pseudomonadota bacterium]
MLFVDALFRFSGVGMLALLGYTVWRDHRQWRSTPYLVLSCISVAALFMGYLPEPLTPPEPIYLVVRFVDVPHLVFVWLFALSLFDDRFQLRWYHMVVGVVYSLPIFYLRLRLVLPLPMLPMPVLITISTTSVLLMLHLCYNTLRGRTDDLLVKRRASRVYFVVLITIVAAVAAFTDPLPNDQLAVDKRTLKMLSIWIAITWGTVWMLRFGRDAVAFGRSVDAPNKALTDKEQALKIRLLETMTEGAAFRESDLTIAKLSARIGVSQHQLRHLINSTLGYPNFSQFLNDYRIDAIKAALVCPDSPKVPVLTLALDHGFKSLSTFNKAFKERTGMTPTEFRARHSEV